WSADHDYASRSHWQRHHARRTRHCPRGRTGKRNRHGALRCLGAAGAVDARAAKSAVAGSQQTVPQDQNERQDRRNPALPESAAPPFDGTSEGIHTTHGKPKESIMVQTWSDKFEIPNHKSQITNKFKTPNPKKF